MAKKQPVVDHYLILSRRPAFEVLRGISTVEAVTEAAADQQAEPGDVTAGTKTKGAVKADKTS